MVYKSLEMAHLFGVTPAKAGDPVIQYSAAPR
jgi:hypothetical protein